MQWKLVHTKQRECIENEGGKTLSYNPNLGIQIIERDGYAFKDLNDNGQLDPFEDWRLPLTKRVEDFRLRFHLWQEDDCLYYKKGKILLPEDFCNIINANQQQALLLSNLGNNEDTLYIKKNYIIAMLLLMFDNDYDAGKEDYLMQLMMQSMDLGLLENIVYSIIEALKKFIENTNNSVLQPMM